VTLLLFVRRLHLYLGLFFLPWVVMFGVTSYPFSHPVPEQPKWSVLVDRPYTLEVPPDADLRAVGARIHADAGLSGRGFYVNQPNAARINVHDPDFLHPTRITYFIEQKRLLAEQREFVWRQFLTSMHARGGYELHSPGNTVWAVLVDLTCVALLVWIASGFIMWWLLPGSRSWGWAAIAAGLLTFSLMVAAL
jgi:hypothetical protein